MSKKFKGYSIEIDGQRVKAAVVAPLGMAANWLDRYMHSEAISRYEQQVELILNKIAGNPVGLIVLNTLPKNRTVLIYPFKKNVCDAGAIDDWKSWMRGNDIEIEFSPEPWKAGTKCNPSPTRSFGTEPDEILFHELIHANRYARGTIEKKFKIQNGMGHTYDDIEEFLAVVLTNIYMSANKKTQFRNGHKDFSKLNDHDSTSEGFLADFDNNRFTKHLEYQDPLLISQIANLTSINFNPFAFKNGGK